MPDNNLTNLIMHVLARTEDGIVNWTESAKRGTFSAAFERSGLNIYSDGRAITIELLNSNGQVVDTYTINRPRSSVGGSHERYDAAKQLYELAKNQARKIDDLFKDIMSS